MTEAAPLTLAYLADHPGDAARVLETVEPEALAAFVATVPVRLAAPVLTELSSWRTGHCLVHMPPPRAAALVDAMSDDDAAACLRVLTGDQRKPIMAELPSRRARTLGRQLQYHRSLVGAIMNTETPAVARDALVGEALAQAQRCREGRIAQVYVVDAGRAPIAAADLASLIDAGQDEPVHGLAQSDFAPVRADAGIDSVARGPGWSGQGVRPVVDGQGRLIGHLRLARVVADVAEAVPAPAAHDGPALTLARAYMATTAGLLRAAAGLLGQTGRRG